MGKTQSKDKLGEPFTWQKLSTGKETCGYDPRFEDVCFATRTKQIVIGDLNNRIYRFDLNSITQSFEMKPLFKYDYIRDGNVGKHFDQEGDTLIWNAKQKYLYCLMCQNNIVHKLDCDTWLKETYPNEKAWIPEKQSINFGQGTIFFMIGRHKIETDPNAKISIFYDLCHLNVVDGKIISKVTIQTQMFDKKLLPQYWGFRHNPKYNCVSIVVGQKGEKKEHAHHYILLVSLHDGKIIWKDNFQFVQEVDFNADGSYMVVFERSKETKNGYVHVLNVARLEWMCQIKLKYGGVPLGWDGFTWCGDSLVFMAPYTLSVLTPEEIQTIRRPPITDTEDNSEQKNEPQGALGLDEEEQTTDTQTLPTKEEEEKTVASTEQEPKPLLTEETIKKMGGSIKGKEICVLGIGKRWWDCEKSILDTLSTLTSSDNVSKLIFEYAGLSWAILQFGLPQLEDTGESLKNSSEVLKSGFIGTENYLLLGKLARDPKTKSLFNHWIFYATKIPNTFDEMWAVARDNAASLGGNIKIGVLGSQDKQMPEIFQK